MYTKFSFTVLNNKKFELPEGRGEGVSGENGKGL